MTKVYCKNCKYHHWLFPYYCKHKKIVIDTFLNKTIDWDNAEVKNENNDCKDYCKKGL